MTDHATLATVSKLPASSTNGSFHSGVWDYAAKRPIVDGKYEDPVTGELREAGSDQYSGPPDVEIVVINLCASETTPGPDVYRSARPFPTEKVLYHAMKVVKEEGLEIHSLNASSYSVTLVLASEIEGKDDQSGFSYVANRISNGLWDEK